MSFTHAYIDLTLSVRADDSAAAIEAAEIERLQHLVAVLRLAAVHPRRLGGEAMPDELSADKRRSKRLLHAAEQSLKMWKAEPAEWAEASKVAATIKYENWWQEHERRLRARQRYIATWAHRYGDANGDARWTKSAIVRLESELKWFAHVMT